MLRLAIIFLVIALLAGLFSYGVVANYSSFGAIICFFVILALAVLSFLGGTFRNRSL